MQALHSGTVVCLPQDNFLPCVPTVGAHSNKEMINSNTSKGKHIMDAQQQYLFDLQG